MTTIEPEGGVDEIDDLFGDSDEYEVEFPI